MAGTTNSSQNVYTFALITYENNDIIVDLNNDPASINISTKTEYEYYINTLTTSPYIISSNNNVDVVVVPPSNDDIDYNFDDDYDTSYLTPDVAVLYESNEISPIIKYNELDEIGSRWQFNRTDEDDYTYQLKLLDIFINKPNSSYNGLLKSIIRKTNIPLINIGTVRYKSTISDTDKTKWYIEVTDTFLKSINVETNQEIKIPLYYTLPKPRKRNTDYNTYDLVIINNYELILECITAGTSYDGPISLPNTLNEWDVITDGTVTWRVVKNGGPRYLSDVVSHFNMYSNNPFIIELYSYLAGINDNFYAPMLIKTTNRKFVNNKIIIPGSNYLDKLIEYNSEHFSSYFKFIKNTTTNMLSYYEYNIDYENGVLNLGDIERKEHVSYIVHNETIDLVYSPVKLFTINKDEDKNVFMHPIYNNNEIIYEKNMNNETTNIPAYNYPMSNLHTLDKAQQKKFPILWEKDDYIYDIFGLIETEIKKPICEVADE